MADIDSALADIRAKLGAGAYRNTAQVRAALVARILQALKWDIWNPSEVFADYRPPSESETGADIALFIASAPVLLLDLRLPESAGDLEESRPGHEVPLRVITDGRNWCFCVNRDKGPSPNLPFARLDLLRDELDIVVQTLWSFLGKWSIESGHAETDARQALFKARRRRAVAESLPEALQEARALSDGNPSEILVALVEARGLPLTLDEAAAYIEAHKKRERSAARRKQAEAAAPETAPTAPAGEAPSASEAEAPSVPVHEFRPDGPIDLSHTALESARIGEDQARTWGSLLHAALRIADARGMVFAELDRITTIEIRHRKVVDSNFQPVEGTDLYVQRANPTYCYTNAFLIAKNLNIDLEVRFRWHNRPGAAHPGEQGTITWQARPH